MKRSTGYKPNFDLDLRYGQDGERQVSTFLHGLCDGTIEVKRDAKYMQTGKVYIEYECLRSDGWKPSGISATTSAYWTILIAESVVIAIPTEIVRRCYLKALDPDLRYTREERDGSHPTRGVAIPLNHFLTWVWMELHHEPVAV